MTDKEKAEQAVLDMIRKGYPMAITILNEALKVIENLSMHTEGLMLTGHPQIALGLTMYGANARNSTRDLVGYLESLIESAKEQA